MLSNLILKSLISLLLDNPCNCHSKRSYIYLSRLIYLTDLINPMMSKTVFAFLAFLFLISLRPWGQTAIINLILNPLAAVLAIAMTKAEYRVNYEYIIIYLWRKWSNTACQAKSPVRNRSNWKGTKKNI